MEYLSAVAFEAIGEDEFNRLIVEQCDDLAVKSALPLKESTGFVAASLLYSMKTAFIVSLLAEDEFMHFYWETTA